MKKNFLIFIIAALSFLVSSNLDHTFILEKFLDDPVKLFKTYYVLNKKDLEYDINSAEGILRYKIFTKNVQRNKELNELHQTDGFGFTPFLDLTYAEFKEKYLMKESELVFLRNSKNFLGSFRKTVESVPLENFEDIDHRSYENPIRNQGSCGSCWAFAAISVVETSHAKIFGKKHQLSEQQLLDCSARDNGCNGGWPTGTFEHIQNNGVAYLNEHPYLGRETGCSSSKLKGIKFVKSFDYCENDCTEEKIYKLLTRGSLVTAMNADDTVMNWRPKSETSIFPGKGCSSTDSVNHAVVISGYKNVGGHNCFIMRNSWGTGWGFGGYALFKVTESCNMNKWVWGVEVNNIGGDENKNEENQDFSKDDEFEHGKKDDKHNDKDNDDDCDDGECEDDQDNENHNVTCKDKFYTDCTSNELKYPKSCTYFTNATTHFGANLRSINPWDSWKFYTENHCAGKEISVKWEENQGKNVCFKNNKKFKVEEVSSGFMITDNLSQKLKPTQIQFFSDYCFGGSFATLQDSYSDTSLVFQAGSVPQRMNSMRFPKKGIAAVIFYEKSNFQGNSCTCFRPEGKSTEIPNLENQCSCMKEMKTTGSFYLIKDQIIRGPQ